MYIYHTYFCFASSASLTICVLNDADDTVETTTAEVSALQDRKFGRLWQQGCTSNIQQRGQTT